MRSSKDPGGVLLTGATGFIGHRLLAELLSAGERCVVTLRRPAAQSLVRLGRLLSDFAHDIGELRAREWLVILEGDLREGLDRLPGAPVRTVVHAAACTRFDTDAEGEPAATNVGGTRRLLEWCSAAGVKDVRLVSSAYVCGRGGRNAPEQFASARPSFHNDYEASKWEAERLCLEWAAYAGRAATIYRPSVVVGEFASGRATKFDAFYVAVRATELLARALKGGGSQRRDQRVRVPGRSSGPQNIVPVDYVARLLARIVRAEAGRGRVYHLVHPSPPTNGRIREALESYFGIAGTRFEDDPADGPPGRNRYERLFASACRPVEPYITDAVTFSRSNAAAAEAAFGIHCPAWDTAALHRLFRYAQAAEWGRAAAAGAAEDDGDHCGLYFERFLPKYIPHSKVARMAGLSATVRFIIGDQPKGQWVCRFEGGRLALVARGPNHHREEFGYRSDREGFWKAVSGRVHPQELFLRGQAEIFGDVEKALKMAMVLNAFAREFPCEREALVRLDTLPGGKCTTK